MPNKSVALPSPPLDLSRSRRLRQALRSALREAVLSVGGLGLLACGGDALDPLPTLGFEPRACETDEQGERMWNPLPGLRVSPPVDHLLFHDNGRPSLGEACAQATNAPRCLEAYQEALLQAREFGCDPAGCTPTLLGTRGDDVFWLNTPQLIKQFLAPIDTPDEAALVARTQWHRIGCTIESGGVLKLDDGTFHVRTTQMRGDCETDNLLVSVDAAGTVTELAKNGPPPNTGCAVGRLPEGLCVGLGRANTSPNDLGGFLAEAAELEAASVPAFVLLARDLCALQAPSHLVQWTLRSIEDEIEHAGTMAALAKQHGGQMSSVSVAPSAAKTHLALAMENAVEGCVRETFGALVAAYQATHATDPAIAAAMQKVAHDELEHAALAHEIDGWLMPLLSEAEQAQVQAAQARAIAEFAQALNQRRHEDVYDRAGFPRADVAAKLHERLFLNLRLLTRICGLKKWVLEGVRADEIRLFPSLQRFENHELF